MTPQVTDAEIRQAIEDAIEDGDTLPGGGVPITAIAARVDVTRPTVRKRCCHLADEGTLIRDWGIDGAYRPTLGYRPRTQGED